MNEVTFDRGYLLQWLKDEDLYSVIEEYFWNYKLGRESIDNIAKKYKQFIGDIYNRQQILKNKNPGLAKLCKDKWEKSETDISNAYRKWNSNDLENCIDELYRAHDLLTDLEKLEKVVSDFEDAKKIFKSLQNLFTAPLDGALPITTTISSFLNKAQEYLKNGDVVKAQLLVKIVTSELERLLYLDKDPLHRELREKRIEQLVKTVNEIVTFAEPIGLGKSFQPIKKTMIKLLSKGYIALCDEMLKEAERFLSNAVYCMRQIIRFETIFPDEVELNEIKDAFRTGDQEKWRIIGDECIQKINSHSLSQLNGIDAEISRLLSKN